MAGCAAVRQLCGGLRGSARHLGFRRRRPFEQPDYAADRRQRCPDRTRYTPAVRILHGVQQRAARATAVSAAASSIVLRLGATRRGIRHVHRQLRPTIRSGRARQAGTGPAKPPNGTIGSGAVRKRPPGFDRVIEAPEGAWTQRADCVEWQHRANPHQRIRDAIAARCR